MNFNETEMKDERARERMEILSKLILILKS